VTRDTVYRLLVLISFGASVAWMYTAPSYEPFIAIVTTVAALLRDEIHGFIGAKRISLNPRRGVIRSLKHCRYSFTHDEFVNPFIIRDLYGWLSDVGDQIVAIDISGANKCNRYYSDQVKVSDNEKIPIVSAKDGEQEFSYQYLGRSFSGIHLLRISDSGGGSGIFGSIMFVTLGLDIAVEISPDATARTERFVVKKIGSLPLGDRFDGKLWFRCGLLYVGPSNRQETIRQSGQWLVIL